MEKTKLFQAPTEHEALLVSKKGERHRLFTFHLMVKGKLKAKQW